MPRPAPRKFDRVDAATFLVATALGLLMAGRLAMERRGIVLDSFRDDPAPMPAWTLLDATWRVAAHLILPFALATLLARLRRPRPRRERLFDQPGFWPGVAGATILGTNLLIEGINYLILKPPLRWGRYFDCRSAVFGHQPLGKAVGIAWAVLLLTRRWRPERGWIDRTGRALGFASILLWLAFDVGSPVLERLNERAAAERPIDAPSAPEEPDQLPAPPKEPEGPVAPEPSPRSS